MHRPYDLKKVQAKPVQAGQLQTKPIVWTIAGSDSGGGAGIQTDLATINDLGCFGCSVITTITAQNSVAVNLVEPVSEAMLEAQLTALYDDLQPAAIKIGLIANQQQLNAIACWLNAFRQRNIANQTVPVIVDPVMVASCGDGLNQTDELDFSPFKGLMTLVTPNAAELFRLEGLANIANPQSKVGFHQAATALNQLLRCNVLAKGGDAEPWQGETASDLFVCQQVNGVSESHQYQQFWLTSQRIDTDNNHGSGCTLSSAIACFMAYGYVLHDAIVMAKAYVSKGLMNSVQYGQGTGPVAKTGWPEDISLYPSISLYYDHQPCDLFTSTTQSGCYDNGFPLLSQEIGIYPVVNDVVMLEALLKANCTTAQLRIKQSDNLLLKDIEQQIQQAITLGRDYNAQVFINDHWQLALKHGAFGIHLGQEDVELANLDSIKEAGIALGLSSHSIFEILLAHQLKPSYIALGHIFPTTTKVMPSAPQGLAKLARYAALLKPVCPTVAIGGIDKHVLDAVKATTVRSVAVVRAITEANYPETAFKQLSHQWFSDSTGISTKSQYEKEPNDSKYTIKGNSDDE
ncbi:thiamine phosphate synthase [Shewanella sp. 1_MG-2023]|uniref:thiamine phosphate synthase n=1 Tax=unclassified Shewanella TaxID=196818 RepID=UPI0026E12839|nr:MULTISPECIES: thiamine phosphate synthase [unclassified Shewanella]MDO6613365.1 thiamine phosphate synthase [Shewanella sp. 7_MG-2023]MDO6773173.1 thiamine phosphate synthase [Shewanella sp. 2_MG-2023]MDO6795375.1 thiamine phosphate synthase [Shewanella sp. 1_MG-2023]